MTIPRLQHIAVISQHGEISSATCFARPGRRVSVRGAGDRPLLALTFDSTASGYWVRKAEGGTVYRLDFWQADQLTPAENALKPHS